MLLAFPPSKLQQVPAELKPPHLAMRTQLWEPSEVLGLGSDTKPWTCIGTSRDGNRCGHALPSTQSLPATQMLVDLSREKPERADYSTLSALTTLCLCPNDHQTTQEEIVITNWRGKLMAEALRLREYPVEKADGQRKQKEQDQVPEQKQVQEKEQGQEKEQQQLEHEHQNEQPDRQQPAPPQQDPKDTWLWDVWPNGTIDKSHWGGGPDYRRPMSQTSGQDWVDKVAAGVVVRIPERGTRPTNDVCETQASTTSCSAAEVASPYPAPSASPFDHYQSDSHSELLCQVQAQHTALLAHITTLSSELQELRATLMVAPVAAPKPPPMPVWMTPPRMRQKSDMSTSRVDALVYAVIRLVLVVGWRVCKTVFSLAPYLPFYDTWQTIVMAFAVSLLRLAWRFYRTATWAWDVGESFLEGGFQSSAGRSGVNK